MIGTLMSSMYQSLHYSNDHVYYSNDRVPCERGSSDWFVPCERGSSDWSCSDSFLYCVLLCVVCMIA